MLISPGLKKSESIEEKCCESFELIKKVWVMRKASQRKKTREFLKNHNSQKFKNKEWRAVVVIAHFKAILENLKFDQQV